MADGGTAQTAVRPTFCFIGTPALGYAAAVQIKVNGDAHELSTPITVRQLVEGRGLSVQKVAVELNRRLVRSEKYDTELKDADEVEIVTFVGGG